MILWHGDRINNARFDFTFVLFHQELVKGTKCIYMSEILFRHALEKTDSLQIFQENFENHAALNLRCQLKIINLRSRCWSLYLMERVRFDSFHNIFNDTKMTVSRLTFVCHTVLVWHIMKNFRLDRLVMIKGLRAIIV